MFQGLFFVDAVVTVKNVVDRFDAGRAGFCFAENMGDFSGAPAGMRLPYGNDLLFDFRRGSVGDRMRSPAAVLHRFAASAAGDPFVPCFACDSEFPA